MFDGRTGTETQWDTRAELCEGVSDVMHAASILKTIDDNSGVCKALPGLSSIGKHYANEERNAAADHYRQHSQPQAKFRYIRNDIVWYV